MADRHAAIELVDDFQELSPAELRTICGGIAVEETITVTAESPLPDRHVVRWRLTSAMPLK